MGTTPTQSPSPVQVVRFPDGTRIILNLVIQYIQSGSDVVLTLFSGGTFTYSASTADEALQIINGIDSAVTNGYGYLEVNPLGAS